LIVRNLDGGAPVEGLGLRAACCPRHVSGLPSDGAKLQEGDGTSATGKTSSEGIGEDVWHEIRTDSEGGASLPGPGEWEVEVAVQGYAIFGKGAIHSKDATTEVWVYRTTVVRGTVRTAGGEYVREGGMQVVGFPSGDSPKGWGSRCDEIGSAQWMLSRSGGGGGWKDLLWRASVKDGAFEMVLPALDGFGLVATAPGYVSNRAILDLRGNAGGVSEAHFELVKASTFRVGVVDEDGVPLSGTRVRLVSIMRVPNGTVKVDGERVVAAATGGSMGGWSSDQTGISTFYHAAGGDTDGDGFVSLSDSSVKSPDERVFLFGKTGYRGVRVSEEFLLALGDHPIVLHRISSAGGFYQLRWRGAPLAGRARAYLTFAIDAAISLGPTSALDIEDGRLPKSAVVKGAGYQFRVTAQECGTRLGRMTFGDQDWIDLGELPDDVEELMGDVRKAAEAGR